VPVNRGINAMSGSPYNYCDWKESSMPANSAEHDKWFRAKVQEALDDMRPDIPHDEVEAYFTERREAALRKAQT